MSDHSGKCPVCRVQATALNACLDCAEKIAFGQMMLFHSTEDIPDPLQHLGVNYRPAQFFGLVNGCWAVSFQAEQINHE